MNTRKNEKGVNSVLIFMSVITLLYIKFVEIYFHLLSVKQNFGLIERILMGFWFSMSAVVCSVSRCSLKVDDVFNVISAFSY